MGLFDKIKKKKDTQLDRYLDGYKKTGKGLGASLSRLFGGFEGVSDEFLEDLTAILLEADVGPETTIKIVDNLREYNQYNTITTVKQLEETLLDQIGEIYNEDDIKPIHYNHAGVTVILMVGVNGVGKTTTIAKLTKYYLKREKKVALVAADTFRAGAREQLQLWANRLNVTCIAGKDKADPSSVIVEGCKYALDNNIDILLVDTAGRVQNKNHLMQELEKMQRVIGKTIPNQPGECWLVIDATTGQNGLLQAQAFKESAKVTGIILTKFDGTAKGGVILGIRDQWHLPVRFIGTGETADDLQVFKIEDFAESIIEGIEDVV